MPGPSILAESFLAALANVLIRQSTRIVGTEKIMARGLSGNSYCNENGNMLWGSRNRPRKISLDSKKVS